MSHSALDLTPLRLPVDWKAGKIGPTFPRPFSEFTVLMFRSITRVALVVLAFGSARNPALAAPEWKDVEPFLSVKCYSCHGGEKIKGSIDLKALAGDPDFSAQHETWDLVLETIENGDMPPPKSEPLREEEHLAIVGWIKHEGAILAAANSGDPGPVTMRRLTNAEYERSIRDLTGRNFGLTNEFQTDAGGGEGFANTGDVLFLSPASLDKYIGAARKLADHATILPGTGIVFHEPRIGLRGPEQVKAQAEQGLYVWYQQKSGPHLPKDTDDMREGDYLLACWKHRHFKTPLDSLAKADGLSSHFLHNWWKLLNSVEPKSRYLDLVRLPWRALPGPEKARPGGVAAVAGRIGKIEADLLSWNNPAKPGSGVQRRQQDADGIRAYPMNAEVKGHERVHLCFGEAGDGATGDVALVTKIDVKFAKGGVNYVQWLDKRLGELRGQVAATPPPKDLEALRKTLASLETARALFGKHPLPGRRIDSKVLAVSAPSVVTLPLPAKAVSVRAETRLDLENPGIEQGTMQWEMTTGKPRDLKGVLPGVLTIWKRRTEAARRTMGEFNQMKQAFPDMFERRLDAVADNLHRSKPGIGVYYYSDEQLGEILGKADRATLVAMRKDWRLVSARKLNTEQSEDYDNAMIWHLHRFASRAWRRPLEGGEENDLAAFYRAGVAKGLDRESAAREVLVRILVSPHFLYKAETLPSVELTAAPDGDLPLGPWELASRLSYFLWASLPDEKLRAAAADGTLVQPAVLAAQAQRLLKDPRSAALAEEFAGQWLKFSGFAEHDGVDAKRFPEMTREIRDDMEREAVEFFSRLFREDRPIADIVTGKTSFLNERLAAFYGVPGVEGPEFREVDLSGHRRGGLLGMGAILTKTSRPTRTSPVLRGDYLYAVVLGHSSPPPPPNVPELKEDGLQPASLREAMMRHREDRACSVCHDRIDPLGFVLESFDPVGRLRSEEGLDDTGEMRDGTLIDGWTGLRDYLTKNADTFTGNFSRKLLGYALGRSVLPSDKALLDQIAESVSVKDGRVSAAVIEIVTSRQFRNRRHEVSALAAATAP